MDACKVPTLLVLLLARIYCEVSRCCVLVGQMKTALLEIKGTQYILWLDISHIHTHTENYSPDRIIIETSCVARLARVTIIIILPYTGQWFRVSRHLSIPD